MTVRQKILEAIADLQGAGSRYVSDQDIATKVDLDLEEVRGHLDLLDEDERLDLAKSRSGSEAFLQPKHKIRMKEDAMAEEKESPATAVDPRKVFVVHGRNDQANEAMFDFLRALDLNPLEWPVCVQGTGNALPYTGETVESALGSAKAVVVLMTPDDDVRLNEAWCKENDGPDETNVRGQARPNVLFETGMALARFPKQTIVVELGNVKSFSDLKGRHVIRFPKGDDGGERNQIATRLETGGCAVNRAGDHWRTKGGFQAALASTPSPGKMLDPSEQQELTDGQQAYDKRRARDFLHKLPSELVEGFLTGLRRSEYLQADYERVWRGVEEFRSLAGEFICEKRNRLFSQFHRELLKTITIAQCCSPDPDNPGRRTFTRSSGVVGRDFSRELNAHGKACTSAWNVYCDLYRNIRETWPDLLDSE